MNRRQDLSKNFDIVIDAPILLQQFHLFYPMTNLSIDYKFGEKITLANYETVGKMQRLFELIRQRKQTETQKISAPRR